MAIAVAQVTGVTNGTAVSFGSSTTTGSLVANISHDFGRASLASGDNTDNKSNTYTLEPNSANANGGDASVGFWYNNAGTRGASHQLTNLGGNQSIIEITGQAAASPVDSTTGAKATDNTSPFSVTAAAAISGNQVGIYGATLDGNTSNVAWGQPSGYTVIASNGNAVGLLVSDAAYKVNETGTPTVAATWTGSLGPNGMAELFVSVKEAAGGGAVVSQAEFPPVWSRVDDILPWETRPYEVQPAFYWWDPGPVVTTADVNTTGRFDAGADFPNAVTADRITVANLAGGAFQLPPTTTHNVTGTGHLPAGADDRAPISHDVPTVAHLPVGVFPLAGTYRYDVPVTGRVDAGAVPYGPISHDVPLAAILEAGALLYVPATHDAVVAGILEAGAVPYGPVSHNAILVGLLEAGAFLMTGPSADVSVIGLLEAGAVLYAPVGHDAIPGGILPAGAFVNPATTTHQVSVAGHLPAGALPYSTIQHLATVAGLLPVGAVQLATVTADRTVVGHLAAAAFIFPQPSGDVSVVGLLEVGAYLDAGTFRKDITPSGTLFAGLTQRTTYSPTISSGGLLEAAVNLQGTVTTTRTVAGHLAAAAAPVGGVTVVFTIAGRLYVGAFPNFDVSATFIDHAAYVATALERFFDEAREAFADTATEMVGDEARERDQGDSRERFTDGAQA